MVIPLANAIFDGNFNIEDFLNSSKKGNQILIILLLEISIEKSFQL